MLEPPGPPFRALQLLTILRRDRPPEHFRKLGQRYPRVAALGVGKQRVYLVSDPELIRQVLVSSSKSLEKGPALRSAALILGDGLLTMRSAHHRARRRLMNPSFHHELMAGYAKVMTTSTDELDKAWRELPEGSVVDMAEQMSALTLSIVGRTLFGTDLGGAADEVYPALGKAMAGWEKLLIPGGDRLMKLPLPAFKAMWAATEKLDQIVRSLVQQAVQHRGDDVVSGLLDAEFEGESLPEEAVRDEAMTLMLAGHETTANALAWCWHLLSGSPRVMRELRRELAELGSPATFADLRQLPLTMGCVAETMRLYPPAWVLEREVTEELTLDGYVLPVGSIVLTSQYALHRDPRFWDRAAEFLPSRWINAEGAFDEDAPGQPRGAWFPFGAGTRQCIGESFAWTEAALVLARLVPLWTPLSHGTPKLHAAVTLRPEGGLPMTLTRAG